MPGSAVATVRQIVTIWSVDGQSHLEFSEPRLLSDSFECTASVEHLGESSSVRLWLPNQRPMLLHHFDVLARDIEGWTGAKHWSSEFAELEFECYNGGTGEIEFHVRQRWPPDYQRERQATILVRSESVLKVHGELPGFLGLRPDAGHGVWSLDLDGPRE
jgi:hypothetical protein